MGIKGYFTLIILVILTSLEIAFAQNVKFNNIPQLQIPIEKLNELIIPSRLWKPFSDINTPNAVPENVKQAYINEAEKIISYNWRALPASLFLEYSKTNNRENFELLLFERRKYLAVFVLAEFFERKGRFTDQVVDGIWAICEESFWGVPAHLFLQKENLGLPDLNDPVVDLFASETAAEMAWVYYLIKPQLDDVNPLIAQRLYDEVNKRILVPYLNNYEWTYLGYKWQKNPSVLRRVNNWNPWVNSNVLATALILSKDDQRNRIIHKTLESINNYIAPFPADGGSDEGPQYWSRAAGALFEYLDLLKSASNGKIDAFQHPLVKKMAAYIYKVYIKDSYFVNYGDADAVLDLDPSLLYRFGVQVKSDTLKKYAAYIAKKSKYGEHILLSEFGNLNRILPGLLILNKLAKEEAKEPLLENVWLPEIELMAARSFSNSSKGLYLAAKGSNNGVSHNHNDVGNFVVYLDGKPVLIDAGPQTYTSATFSSKRYELWNNQSAYHNLPTINGEMQHEGANFKSSDVVYKANSNQASLTLNIANAYPAEAKVLNWNRKITLTRRKEVSIVEKFELREYVLPYEENFISPLVPKLEREGVVTLTDKISNKVLCIYYDQKRFSFCTDKIVVANPPNNKDTNEIPERMSFSWGKELYRIRLISKANRLKDKVAFIIK